MGYGIDLQSEYAFPTKRGLSYMDFNSSRFPYWDGAKIMLEPRFGLP